ncbi:RNA polymerase sigma factor [Paeniglutamicibacter sp. MACA_103]|uniref:RNA polymerase sigma factor n=1 Tax=Paeniglutamicibacter sp. MACA_103 TaxID=3377337 RepID=UPI003896434E
MNQLSGNDQDLWDRCAAGNANAFGTLFDRHADALFRFCLSACGSWHDAEELVSISYMEAWRKRGTIRLERDSLLPWLIGVAAKSNINRARTAKRYRALIEKLPYDEETTAFEPHVAEMLDAQVLAGKLLDGAGLSAVERAVAVLCLMFDFTYSDAARALGTPVGTIRSRLNRARKKLRAVSEPRTEPSLKLSPETSRS